MAGMAATVKAIILLAAINRLYADPTCTQEMSVIGPKVICEAGNPNYILRKGLVSDNNLTKGIVLRNCNITRIERDAFNALPSLEELDLSQNRIEQLTKLFRQTPNLKALNLSGSFIEQIRLNVFDPSLEEVPVFATRSNLNTMTRLSLTSNHITRLHDSKVFAELVNLEYLELGGNLIDFIHDDVFKPMKNIRAISLHHNKITRVPENLFTNLNKLLNINLSGNLIEYVPVNAFRHTSLKSLNLSGNRFTYLQDNFCLELRNSGARLQKFFFNQNPWQCACLNDMLREVKKIGIEYNGNKFKGVEGVCVTGTEFQCQRQLSYNEEYIKLYYNLVRK